ncbi:MAG: hypothetical protein IKU08_10585 [Clostridia bacterium]|nr:hypothetical protein [Clostridia bacterium]
MNLMVEAMSFIDDELIENACVTSAGRKRNYGRYIAAAAVLAVVFATAFAGVEFISSRRIEPAPNPNTSDYFGTGDSGNSDKYTGDYMFFTEGYHISDEEIRDYVGSHKYDMIGAIAAEYGDFESEYKIFVKGYRHINLGSVNTLKLNFVDLPIMRGDKIIAYATLYEYNGELRNDLSVRGVGIDEKGDIFNENPDDELVFLYYGMREIVVTPSNRIYSVGSASEESLGLDYSIDYYGNYKTEYNTFSLGDLKNKDNYITVVPLPEERVTGYTKEETITEAETESFELPTLENTSTADITLDEIISKEIVSVEWGNGYNLLMDKPLKKTTDEQAERIIGFVYGMKPVKAEKVEYMAGGGWLARLNYADGTYAIVCVRGPDQIVFENAEGYSIVYDDLSGNATKLENYLISLVE